LQPIGDKGIAIVGGDTIRGFTNIDQVLPFKLVTVSGTNKDFYVKHSISCFSEDRLPLRSDLSST
jgi:hypothetical protein